MNTKPYVFQLVAITSLLNKPSVTPPYEAYHMLFKLWSKYLSDAVLCKEIKLISKDHPDLEQEFRNRIHELERIKDEKGENINKEFRSCISKIKFSYGLYQLCT